MFMLQLSARFLQILYVNCRGYLSAMLCHSCSTFVINSALSNITEPFGNNISFSKKLDFTLLTSRGFTFQL